MLLTEEREIPTTIEDLTQEYVTLAAELGIAGSFDSEETRKRFASWLSAHGMVTYDYDQVMEHLAADAPNMRIDWIPLLARHREKRFVLLTGDYAEVQYERPVPLAVLMLVKEIVATFPAARFYVSDYAVTNPDPFLLVKIAGGEYVIEHWGEPTFGLR